MINISTEFMKNYKQTELMSPEKKFEALQTSNGCSLLFSIGTDAKFYVTAETVEHTTGWEKTDLSSSLNQTHFISQEKFVCKTFEVGQNVEDGTIGMAMAINSNKKDHLFLCLGNPDTDTSWIKCPQWIEYPFDNPYINNNNIIISNIYLAETKNNTQFIIVDILRDPTSPLKVISRYYIDVKKEDGFAWHAHDVAIDLEAENYSSCLGRPFLKNKRRQPNIDGVYTSGKISNTPQLIFQPLYNEYSNFKIPANPVRLNLPNNLIADSIASCRKLDMSTDLYVCSKGKLFYFSNDNQLDGATAILLLENKIFKNVKKMYAHQSNNITIIWGINGNDEVFYTSCPAGQEKHTSAWSFPVPIVTNVDIFSPYINKLDSGNTIFVSSQNTLQKLINSPENFAWQSQSITLPSLDTKDTQKYTSFTTRIEVTDENNQPKANIPIIITTSYRTAVYINHLYYIVDSTGIEIKTNSLGTITIVEWVDGINGTKFNIAESDNNVTVIDPTEAVFKKLTALDSIDKLKNATINDESGNGRPLICNTVSESDLESIAKSNLSLANIYNNLSSSNTQIVPLPHKSILPPESIKNRNPTLLATSDIFNWLKSGVEAIIDIIEDSANKAWHFVATIAEDIYHCVLDTTEKVIGAAVWIFNKVKTGVHDLVEYLKFLFNWDDILITHKVLKNLMVNFAKYSIKGIDECKNNIISFINEMQTYVSNWANISIPEFDQTPAATTTDKHFPYEMNSAPAQFGIHHYSENAEGAILSLKPISLTCELFEDLLTLLEKESKTLVQTYEAIKTNIIDPFNSLSLTEIINRFIAILGDSLLQTTENILVASLEILKTLSSCIFEVMSSQIDIPVLSWLYEEISHEKLSVLDLLCLISAIPATIVYKSITGNTPFKKDDDLTKKIIEAKSLEETKKLCYSSNLVDIPCAIALDLVDQAEEPSTNLSSVKQNNSLEVIEVITGFCAFVGSAVTVFTTNKERESYFSPVPLENPSKYLGYFKAFGNMLSLSPTIIPLISNEKLSFADQLNTTFSSISLVNGFIDGTGNFIEKKILSHISSYIDSALNFAGIAPSIMTLAENKKPTKILATESIGNIACNLSGIVQLFATTLEQDLDIDYEPDSRAATLGVLKATSIIQYSLMAIFGICIPISSCISAFDSK